MSHDLFLEGTLLLSLLVLDLLNWTDLVSANIILPFLIEPSAVTRERTPSLSAFGFVQCTDLFGLLIRTSGV